VHRMTSLIACIVCMRNTLRYFAHESSIGILLVHESGIGILFVHESGIGIFLASLRAGVGLLAERIGCSYGLVLLGIFGAMV